MIVMSLKFGGYKVTEKDIGTMIEKKLESTEDKVPVFTPAPSAVKNEQKNMVPSAHQTRTSDKTSATQNKSWNERMTANSNSGRSKYANQSKQHKIFPKTAGQMYHTNPMFYKQNRYSQNRLQLKRHVPKGQHRQMTNRFHYKQKRCSQDSQSNLRLKKPQHKDSNPHRIWLKQKWQSNKSANLPEIQKANNQNHLLRLIF